MITQRKQDGLRGRFIQLDDVENQEIESALPSLALFCFEEKVDDDRFIKAVKSLLNKGIENLCMSGEKASHLEDIAIDVIINGKYEKGIFFKRKSILTSFHVDESIEEIVDYIKIQVRLTKLNPIVNVIYEKPSETLSSWKSVLSAV